MVGTENTFFARKAIHASTTGSHYHQTLNSLWKALYIIVSPDERPMPTCFWAPDWRWGVTSREINKRSYFETIIAFETPRHARDMEREKRLKAAWERRVAQTKPFPLLNKVNSNDIRVILLHSLILPHSNDLNVMKFIVRG